MAKKSLTELYKNAHGGGAHADAFSGELAARIEVIEHVIGEGTLENAAVELKAKKEADAAAPKSA